MADALNFWQKTWFRLRNFFLRVIDSPQVFFAAKTMAGIFLSYCFLLIWNDFSWKLILAAIGLYAAWDAVKEAVHKYGALRGQR
jgi:hypothetical protein